MQHLRPPPHLDWEVVAAEREVISAAEWRVLRSHVHLQVLEKVHVFVRREGHEHTHRARDGGVHQRLAAARDQRSFLWVGRERVS